MADKKKSADLRISREIERRLADMRALTDTDADRRLRELIRKGSESSTGLEDIDGAVRRLRAL